jgi:hypothetical protein
MLTAKPKLGSWASKKVDGIVEQERRYTTPRYTTVRSKTRKSPQLQ